MRYLQLVGCPWNARLALTTAASVEPVSVDEQKEHSRISTSDENALLEAMVTAARQWVEEYLGRQLTMATWTLHLDEFPYDGAIELPRPPLLTVSSVKYYDSARTLQTLAGSSYYSHVYTGPEAPMGRVELAVGEAWPSIFNGEGAVQIAYTAGYGATAMSVPLQIRQAIKILAGEMYERREQVIVGTISTPVALTVERLLWPLRVW